LVGDRCQAIYGWRGAIDAMARFQADQRLVLSQSFRFGPAIATEANKWLALLDAPLRLRGFQQVRSSLGPLGVADAVLCRTNAEAVRQCLQAYDQGLSAALVGGGKDIRRLAEAAITLKAGKGTDHPELFAFHSWAEVKEYVELDAAGSDLKVFVGLIDAYGPEQVIAIVDQLVAEDRADVVVSTAHKAKGREWPRVRIAGDFHPPKPKHDQGTGDGAGNGLPVVVAPAEAMLAYVAVTRARLVLDREGLAWVDDQPVAVPTAAADAGGGGTW
jgi:superfamily I DNA/RNA helicase